MTISTPDNDTEFSISIDSDTCTSAYTIDTNSIYSTNGFDDVTFTIDSNTQDTVDINWIYNNIHIDPNEVEKMCKEYPGLEKVWRNFKSVYDMCKQDYEGKKKAGEIDDDIPF